jgi:hypothetical protein
MRGKKTDSEKKSSSPGGKVSSSAKVKAAAAAAAAERQEWGSLRLKMKPEQAIAYHMEGTYRAKALLSHSLFGLGFVTRVAGPRKIEVLFEEGKKLLRCQ